MRYLNFWREGNEVEDRKSHDLRVYIGCDSTRSKFLCEMPNSNIVSDRLGSYLLLQSQAHVPGATKRLSDDRSTPGLDNSLGIPISGDVALLQEYLHPVKNIRCASIHDLVVSPARGTFREKSGRSIKFTIPSFMISYLSNGSGAALHYY